MGAVSGFSGKAILNYVGWIVVLVLLAGAGYWYFGIFRRDKKIYNKNISIFDIVGAYWQLVGKDVAKVVKIGSGGFEILYFKNAKTYRIGYGGRVGKDTYYFFIMPDGYYYNGMLSAGIKYIDKEKGLIPIVTTNPLMRGQYTALEKQIDSLHAPQQKFWEKYGGWIMSIAFVLIAGVMLWLSYKEFAHVSANLAEAIKENGMVMEKLANLAGNVQGATAPQGGLVPV